MESAAPQDGTWIVQVRQAGDPWMTIAGGDRDSCDRHLFNAGSLSIRSLGYQMRAMPLDGLAPDAQTEAMTSLREMSQRVANGYSVTSAVRPFRDEAAA